MKVIKILLGIFLALIATGCGPKYADYYPYYDNGVAKPAVALVPVINKACLDVPWDLSEELTDSIRYEAMQHGDLYLLSKEQVNADLNRIGDIDFFGRDISFSKQFCGANYVVILELLEHWIKPGPCNCNLIMKMRIRVIDIRCETPRIVLQEVFGGTKLLPRDREWTPANAHSTLVRDVVNRIESILWSVR